MAWRLDVRRITAAIDVVLDAAVLPLRATVTRVGIIDTPAEVELGCVSLT